MSDIGRVVRSHTQARDSYDRLSRWYDFIEGGWESRSRRLGLELLQVKPGEKLLEIGCGTGSSLLELSSQACSEGLDLSYRMLSLARRRLEKSARAVHLAQGDALNLPFQPGYFNSVFMAFTLELMDTPEIPCVLAEIRGILLPNGRLGVVSLSMLGGRGLMRRLYGAAHNLFPTAIDCRPIYARRALEEAGFTITDYHILSQTGLGIEVVIGRVE